MKKILTIAGLSILFLILDNTLVTFFAFKGFYPSLLFVFVISYSIANGSWEGLWVGVFAGLLQDLYFFNGFGVNMLINMLLCAVAGKIGTSIFKEKNLVSVTAIFLLTAVKGILIFSILFVLGQYTSLSGVLYISVYSMIVSIIMYRKVYKLCQKNYMKSTWKF